MCYLPEHERIAKEEYDHLRYNFTLVLDEETIDAALNSFMPSGKAEDGTNWFNRKAE